MKRSLEALVILTAIFAICSCASKPDIRPADIPPPPSDASAAEAAAYKAEVAAKRAEDSSKEAKQSAERAERAAQRAEASAAGRPAPAIKPEPEPTKPAEVEWTYEKNAIRLLLKGDPELNLYQKTSHTLVFCIYNLKDPNVFNQLREERGGLVKLLEGGRFDPSVTYSKRLVIEPGQELTEVWDRSEGARFVGVAAGYYHFQKEKMVKLFPIPVVSEKKGKTVFHKPGPLNIGVYLGAQEIQDLR